MAQSLHIGLYGFSTNLPFGIWAIYFYLTLLHQSLSSWEIGDWPRRCSTICFQSSKVVFQLLDHFGSNYLQTLLMARPHLTLLIPRFVVEPFDDSEAFLACISWPFRESAHHNPVLGGTHATQRQRSHVCSQESNSGNWTEKNIRMEKTWQENRLKVWKGIIVLKYC